MSTTAELKNIKRNNKLHLRTPESWQGNEESQNKQELIRRWDSVRELLRSAPGSYPNSLK